MNITGIREDDIVRCDVNGRVFEAFAESRPQAGRLAIRPIHRNVTYTEVTSRQVICHWSKRGRPRKTSAVAA